jgi:type II secretory pathway pseudopilin PulG
MDSSLRANIRGFFRALSPGRNPLRRTIDRVESLLIALVMLLALAGLPVAAAMGAMVYNQGAHAAAQAAATERMVQAVVLQDAPVANPGPDGRSIDGGVPAQVTWPGADGRPHVDAIPVAAGSKAGTVVPLWVDQAEHVMTPPPTIAQALGSAVIASAGTLLGIELLCALLVLGVHATAVRATSRSWQQEWAVVEPQWRRMQL